MTRAKDTIFKLEEASNGCGKKLIKYKAVVTNSNVGFSFLSHGSSRKKKSFCV